MKKGALTVKTPTGVNRFQEEENYAPWFPMLFALVKTCDSCQPERAVEPTDGSREDVNEESRVSSKSSKCPASAEDSEESTGNGSSDGTFCTSQKPRNKKERSCLKCC